jgi:hypothetical protein
MDHPTFTLVGVTRKIVVEEHLVVIPACLPDDQRQVDYWQTLEG